jgi:stress-induced-phosphoprotein 1
LEEAIKAYTEAIEIDSANEILYSNRSAAYAKNAQYDLALEDAEKAVSVKPAWAKVNLFPFLFWGTFPKKFLYL